MSLLQGDERQNLIDRLLRLPNIRETGVRRSLVAGLPEALRSTVAASDVPQIEVMSIIEVADGDVWSQLPDESWSIIKVVENSVFLVRGSKLGGELEKLLNTLKSRAVELAAPKTISPEVSPPLIKKQLTAKQSAKLHAALLNAFDPPSLKLMLSFQLNVRLEDITAPDNFKSMVLELIDWAERHGTVSELINGALADNPGNAALRSFAEEMGFVASSPSQPSSPGHVVQVIKPTVQDVEAWRSRLSQCEPTVCQVNLTLAESKRGAGTGFLVGPSVAMTSYHVVNYFIENRNLPPQISLRFGYKMSPDGTTLYQGQDYHLSDDWLIDSDETLDFALLRVAGSPGDEPDGNQPGAPPRRWLRPKDKHIFKPGDEMYVIQHPLAGPMKIALATDSVVSVNPEQTRVAYRMDTEPGSAGSPCFTRNWELVAIHHSADPGRGISFGTPMAAIVSRPQVKAALGS